MQIKTLEIRDRMTRIVALAIKPTPRSEMERALLASVGFGPTPYEQSGYVFIVRAADARAQWDPYAWGDRTMAVAHHHVLENWDHYSLTDVVDVEFILGETAAKKELNR
jgi:hypothetical protein